MQKSARNILYFRNMSTPVCAVVCRFPMIQPDLDYKARVLVRIPPSLVYG